MAYFWPIFGCYGQSDNENFVDFIPAISETDYMNDSQFAGIFHYLSTGELMNDEKVDKKTLLLVDQFFIQYGHLFRLELPRSRRVSRVQAGMILLRKNT